MVQEKTGPGEIFLWVRRKKRDRENGEDFSPLEKEEEEEEEKRAPMINDATAAAAARAQSPEKLSSRLLLLLLPSAPGKRKSFGSDFLRLPGCSER